MSEKPRPSDEQEPAPQAPSLGASADLNGETLPLNTATTPNDQGFNATVSPAAGARSVPDPTFEGTKIDRSIDADLGYAPTMGGPAEVDQALESVRQQARRRSAAVLHTKVGDYEIERELGRGGMGVVYKARHRQLRRDVALKMILAGSHAGPDQLERFLTEARSVAQLQHPNIVQIFDIGEQEGLPYFSLEFVDGQSLQQQLNKQPQDARVAAQTVEVLARAMQYAHDHGVLHRDLKPANVLVSKEGQCKISDFGLAKKVADDESEQTRTGTVMGTPSYMSPEQASGLTHEVGPPADQYSLGAMLYEMLTGRPPFHAARAYETILQVIQDDPIAPRQLQRGTPVDLETICLKSLQKDATKRYPNCLGLAEDLHRFLDGEPIIARPVGSLERAWRWCKRNPRIAIPSSLAVLLLLAVSVVSSWASITVSRQNVTIKHERDYAKSQEALARQHAGEAKEAQHLAEVARKKADENFNIATNQRKLALGTLYDVVTKVDTKLIDVPGTRELRQELITDAMAGLKRVEESDDTKSLVDRTMGVGHQRMAAVFQKMGNSPAAIAEHELALAIFERLLAIDPQNDWAKWDAALTYDQLGSLVRESTGNLAKTKEYYLKALALREALQAGLHIVDPGLNAVKVEQSLINSNAKLGTMALSSGDVKLARDYFLKSLRSSEQLVAADPTNVPARTALAGSFNILGVLSVRLLELEAAGRYYEKALAIRQQLADETETSVQFRLDLSKAHQSQGNLALQYLKQFDAARQHYELALNVCLPLHASDPKDADVRRDLATVYHSLGTACLLLHQEPQTLEHFRAALALRNSLASEDTTNVSKQLDVLHSQARAGEHAEAYQLGQSLVTRMGQNSRWLYGLACGYAICAATASAKKPGTEVPPATENVESAEVAKYRDAAFDSLRQAVAAGYTDLPALDGDPDLAAIRSDPRFAEVLQSLKGH